MNDQATGSSHDITTPPSPTNTQLAYLLLRLGLGLNIFFHGLVRLPKLEAFAQGMIKNFEPSMIPGFLVAPLAYAIPILEVIIGAGILLGFKTRLSLTANAVLMLIFITGCCTIENWGAVNSQMIVLLTTVILVATLQHNRFKLSN